jgi:hypothetical protein
VVRGRSCLVLAIAHDLRGMFGTSTACLLIDAAIVVGCGLLTALFAPLLAGLNTLLGALDGDTRRRFLLLLKASLSWVALVPAARGVATSHYLLVVLLGASADMWRGHNRIPP